MLSKFFLSLYFRLRRWKKALRNYRRFGALIFGSLLLATFSWPTFAVRGQFTPVLTSIVVSPASVTLSAGESQQFVARAYDQTGQVMSGLTFTWNNKDKLGALIASGQDGNQTALYRAPFTVEQNQTAIIQAIVTYQGRTPVVGEAVVHLAALPQPPPAVLTSVIVSPASLTLQAGGSQQFTAKGYDQTGNPISGLSFSWTKTGLGSLSASGFYVAPNSISSNQDVTIQAATSYQGATKTGTAIVHLQASPQPPLRVLTSVIVSPASITLQASQTQQFVAQAYDQTGTPITGLSFVWSRSGAGTITAAGLYSAPATISQNQDVTIQAAATYQGAAKAGTAVVHLITSPQPPQRVLTSVIISPASITLNASGTQQFVARAYDQTGTPITGLSFTWTKVGLGTLGSSGLYTAPANITSASTAAITASTTHQGVTKSGNAAVYLQPEAAVQPILTRITLNPNYAVTLEGGSVQFSVSAFDQFDRLIISGLTINWRVVQGSGSISSNGLYLASQVNELTYEYIEARVSQGAISKTASAVVEVRNKAPELSLSQIVINPIISSLPVGSLIQFVAIAYDQNGDAIPGLVFTWSRQGVGAIDSLSGFYSAGSLVGSVTVRAETLFKSQVYSSTRSFQVIDPNQPFLAYVTLSPQAVSLQPNASQLFIASAFDQRGNLLTPNAWSWNLAGSGSLQSAGSQATYLAGASGTALITATATYQGINQSAQASVVIQTPGTGQILAGVTLDQYLLTLQPGQSGGLTATAVPLPGQTIDQSQVLFSWSLLQPGIGALAPSSGRTATFTAGSQTGSFNGVIRVAATLGSETALAVASVVIEPLAGQGTLSSVILIPERLSMPINTYQQLTARALDSFGNPVSSVSFIWQILAGNGQIFGSGSVVQLLSGSIAQPLTVRVTALQGGISLSDTKVINVLAEALPGLLNTVIITPDPVTLNIGQQLSFAATAYDAGGLVLSGVTFIWETLSGAAGSITPGGLFTAGNTLGTFSDAVRVTAIKDGIVRYDFATVIIRSGAPTLGSLIGSTLTATLESPTATTDSTIRYNLTVRNSGSGALSNVRAVFFIPLYTRFSSALSPWGTLQVIDRQLVWSVGSLLPNESKSATIRVLINGLPRGTVRIRGQADLTASERPAVLSLYSNEIEARPPAGVPTADGGPVYGPTGLVSTGLPILGISLSGLLALLLTLLVRQRLSVKKAVIIEGEEEEEGEEIVLKL